MSLPRGTAYYDLEADPAILEIGVRALAEGNSLRATVRIIQIDKDTACDWLNRVGQHCGVVMLHLWHNLHFTRRRLDELWGLVRAKERHLPYAEVYKETYGDAGMWIVFALIWRFVLARVVGKRNQESANLLLDRVAYVPDEHLPVIASDQLPEYRTTLAHTYSVLYQPQHKGNRGHHPKPSHVPYPDLLYAQVVRVRQNSRVAPVRTKVVFGDSAAIDQRLAEPSVSDTVNTSFAERDDLSQRQCNRRLIPRTNVSPKELTWFDKQLWLSLAYNDPVLPQHSLQQQLETPEPTRGTDSPRRLEPRTPAMAADTGDHVWTTTELLYHGAPAWFLDQLSKIVHLFPPLDSDGYHWS